MAQNKTKLSSACNILFKISLGCLSVFFHISFCFANQNMSDASHCIIQFEKGSINWTTGNIMATGQASPEDNRQISIESVLGSARADANRHLINILKQIKINNILSVADYALNNDIILAGIEKTARDSIIEKQYYTSALSVQVIIKTSIFGGFLQLLLPEQIKQIPQIIPEKTQTNIKKPEYRPYTGLIIDARKLGVEPVLNPVVISEQGHDIYSSKFISREFAVQNGVCRYFCDIEQALLDDKIGNHPLVLKGLRKEGNENNAIIISMSDYRVLEKVTERHDFLKKCRIIIVV